MPDKKGIAKRTAQALESAGARVEETRVKREMRGMSETEMVISFAQESLRESIVQSLEGVPGVTLLSWKDENGARPTVP
jgi:hypothetical protein